MREHIEAGVWRVIRNQVAANGDVTVEVGAFVHAVPTPEGFNVPAGSRFVATASKQTQLAISEDDLIQIELHPNAPAPLAGGPPNIDEGEWRKDNKGKNNAHDDVKAEIDAALKVVLDGVNILAFFRGVPPTNRVGGPLTPDELPSFTRGNF